MIRRQLLSTAGRALFGAAMVDANTVASISSKVAGLPTTMRQKGEDRYPDEGVTVAKEARQILRKTSERVSDAKHRMRSLRQFDADIKARTSCSRVYKEALQVERLLIEDIQDSLFYAENDTIISYISRNMDKILKGS